MNIKVSVIMAAYNSEDTISESIDSIVGQTFPDWELIICDDGSDDRTYDIIRRYAERYPGKIIAIRNASNQKLPRSLNHCLTYAKGEYVARMDADDRSCPDRLEKQYAYLTAHPEVDVVGTGMICFDNDRITGRRLPPKEPSPRILGMGVPFFHATIMMKRDVYEQLGGYSRKDYAVRCEDVDLWIRFFANGFRGANLQEPLYYVREDLAASRRRTFRNAVNESKTIFLGFYNNRYPLRQYPFALKPIVSGMIPWRIKNTVHQRRWRLDKNTEEK